MSSVLSLRLEQQQQQQQCLWLFIAIASYCLGITFDYNTYGCLFTFALTRGTDTSVYDTLLYGLPGVQKPEKYRAYPTFFLYVASVNP